MQELNCDRYSASSHHLAWCFLRIAIVLNALRMMDAEAIKGSVECSDADFDMTMDIIRVISVHNDHIFNVLDKVRPEGIAVADSYSAATRKTILAALPGYFKTDDMKTVAKHIGKSLRTAGGAGLGGWRGAPSEAPGVPEVLGGWHPGRMFGASLLA